MKKMLLLALLASSAALASAKVIQYEGAYYDVQQDEGALTGHGSVVAPPSGDYSGDLALYSSFVYEGVKYTISGFVNQTCGFNNSTVTNFTCGFNLAEGDYNIVMRNNTGLQSLKYLYLSDQFTDGYPTTGGLVSLGNTNPDCVSVSMRTEGDENLVCVEAFNVYGPDGKKLKPRLMVEATGELIAPDENNIFHLDSQWMHNGDYCMVLPLGGAYSLVILYAVSEDGKIGIVRTEPAKGQTGVYVEQDGIKYSINGDHAEIGSRMNTAASGELILPEFVEYNGKSYPLTIVHPYAFYNSGITSVTVPAGVSLLNDAFYYALQLTYADVSKSDVEIFQQTFDCCESLKEVRLPQVDNLQLLGTFNRCTALESIELPQVENLYLGSTFTGCTAMESIRLPRGTKVSSAFGGSGMVDCTIDEINEQKVTLRINKFNVFDMDGQALPYEFSVTLPNEGGKTMATDNGDGTYSFDKESFYYDQKMWYPEEHTERRFYEYIDCAYDSAASDYLQEGSTFFGISVKEKEFTGIASVAVDEDAPVQYYNLQGLPVQAGELRPGIYIRQQGKSVTKVLVR